jgi:hypothetical protein
VDRPKRAGVGGTKYPPNRAILVAYVEDPNSSGLIGGEDQFRADEAFRINATKGDRSNSGRSGRLSLVHLPVIVNRTKDPLCRLIVVNGLFVLFQQ